LYGLGTRCAPTPPATPGANPGSFFWVEEEEEEEEGGVGRSTGDCRPGGGVVTPCGQGGSRRDRGGELSGGSRGGGGLKAGDSTRLQLLCVDFSRGECLRERVFVSNAV